MFKLQIVVDDLKNRFPESEGFKITCTHWQKIGEEMAI